MMFFQKPSTSPTYRAAAWGVAILGVVAWTYWYAKQGGRRRSKTGVGSGHFVHAGEAAFG